MEPKPSPKVAIIIGALLLLAVVLESVRHSGDFRDVDVSEFRPSQIPGDKPGTLVHPVSGEKMVPTGDAIDGVATYVRTK